MSNKTFNYSSNLALIGPSPSDSNHIGQLSCFRMVQECTVNITNREAKVSGIGENSYIHKRSLPPKVSGDLTYYLSDGYNEKIAGLNVRSILDRSVPDGAVDRTDDLKTSFTNSLGPHSFLSNFDTEFDNRNIFILTKEDKGDAVTVQNADLDKFTVMGLGNCYIDSYSLSVSVGQIPTASFGFSAETFYIKPYDKDSGIVIPSVKKNGEPSNHLMKINDTIYQVDRDGSIDPLTETEGLYPRTPASPSKTQITISGDSIGVLSGELSSDSVNLQNVSLSLNIPRQEVKTINSKYIQDKPFLYPLQGQISVSIIVDGFQEGDSRFFENQDFDITLSLKGYDSSDTNCELDIAEIEIIGARIASQSFSQQVGGRMTWNVAFTFEEGDSTDVFDKEFHDGTKGMFFNGLNGLPEDMAISLQGGDTALLSEESWIATEFSTFLQLD